MNYSFWTTNKEIDLTILDSSCEIRNATASIFWRLDIDNNAYGITGMTPRIEKIDAKWDVIVGDAAASERHEVIENFKGRGPGKDKPNAWALTEEIIEEFGNYYVDELIIDMDDWSLAVIYNQDNPGA